VQENVQVDVGSTAMHDPCCWFFFLPGFVFAIDLSQTKGEKRGEKPVTVQRSYVSELFLPTLDCRT